jgi:hypothetical protein
MQASSAGYRPPQIMGARQPANGAKNSVERTCKASWNEGSPAGLQVIQNCFARAISPSVTLAIAASTPAHMGFGWISQE